MPERPWHALPAQEALAAFATEASGLGQGEAVRRLSMFGLNRLPRGRSRPVWRRLLIQFHNVLIYALLASALVAFLLGHAVDAAVILAVVLINAVVGFVQEGRAEEALEAIREMINPQASVLRDGHRLTIGAEEVVPGDIVLIDSGDRIPADLRLIRAKNLAVNEAILTGESVPVTKLTAPVGENLSIGDRFSMAFSGALVVSGQGTGIAVGTGGSTELGRISALIRRVGTLKTPLTRQMDEFARRLTLLILGVSGLTFAFAFLVRDYAIADAFMAVVGLAVAAIPEGLPATMTVTLAIGVQRMARRNAIIRRLPAVETLGSVSVICSDKTGTLTRNEMMVQTVITTDATYAVSGSGYMPAGSFRRDGEEVDASEEPVLNELLRAGLLCNDANLRLKNGEWRVSGDPMEGALIALALKAGFEIDLVRKQLPRDDEIPFDAAHRFMATLHHSHGDGGFIVIKGAPEQILDMCAKERAGHEDRQIDRDEWHARANDLALQGQRVLALAVKPARGTHGSLAFGDVEAGAVLLGLAGFIDPPREEAIAAVRDCRSAGIRVIMITGDHVVTAREIARQLELADHPKTLTGDQLERLDDDALRSAALDTSVFARTTPEHKLRLVEILQSMGLVVAMTGDGVNDAPALKRADVGVAMGRKGTEVAKESARMVLTDDNFASIVAAVREGRTVYDNLMKVIGWTLPTSGGEALTIVAAIAFGLALPITPVQILWVNMITVGALGLTLAFEPTERGAMHRPPRSAAQPILSWQLLWRIGFVSALFLAGAFGIFFWAGERGLPIETARTLVVNTIVVMEIFYLFSVRHVHGTSLTWQGVLGTRAVLTGVAIVTVAQIAFTYAPILQSVFDTRAVSPGDGVVVIMTGVALLFVVELEKWAQRSLAQLGSAKSR